MSGGRESHIEMPADEPGEDRRSHPISAKKQARGHWYEMRKGSLTA